MQIVTCWLHIRPLFQSNGIAPCTQHIYDLVDLAKEKLHNMTHQCCNQRSTSSSSVMRREEHLLIKMTASDWGNRWTMTRGNVSTKVSEFTPLAFVAKKKKKKLSKVSCRKLSIETSRTGKPMQLSCVKIRRRITRTTQNWDRYPSWKIKVRPGTMLRNYSSWPEQHYRYS